MLIIGDLHIGLNLNYRNIRNLRLSYEYSKSNIIFIKEEIEKLEPKQVVFLGDIFDKPKVEPELILLFKSLIDDISPIVKDNIYLLTGNHDLKNKENNILQIFNNYKNVKVIDEITEIDNYLFIPHMEINKNLDLLEKLDTENKIIFSHLDIGHNLPFCIEPDLLFNNYIYIFNGHIHKPYRKRKFINVGSISPTDFSDTAIHSIIHFTGDNLINIPSRIRFFSIDNINDITDIYKEIESFNPKMVFLRYNLEYEDTINELIEHFENIVAIQPYIKQYENQKDLTALNIQNEESNETFLDIDKLFKDYMKEVYNIDISNIFNINENF